MRFDLVAPCTDIFTSVLNNSILKKAFEKGIVKYHVYDLHDYSNDKFGRIDDYVYGGSAGMLIKCDSVFSCIESLKKEREYDEIIYLTPEGKIFNQTLANELSLKKNILLLSGRYKGIDQRIRDELVTREISVGDYVLSGGELASLIIVDSVVRLLPGAISDSSSALEDSFMNGLLEPPQYTRPDNYKGLKVPEILLSGHHKQIEEWKMRKSLEKTKKLRPDLLDD